MVYIFCPFFQEILIQRWKTLQTRKDMFVKNLTNVSDMRKMMEHFEEGYGIGIIHYDADLAEEIKSVYQQECVAFSDIYRGYGVFFTQGGLSGIYGDEPNYTVLCQYWDDHSDEIDGYINAAKGPKDLMPLAHAILIGCSDRILGINKFENKFPWLVSIIKEEPEEN